MGKRKRRVRILKECNRSKRLGKIIGRALAGVVDPQCPPLTGAVGEFAGALGGTRPSLTVIDDPIKDGAAIPAEQTRAWVAEVAKLRHSVAVIPAGFLIRFVPEG